MPNHSHSKQVEKERNSQMALILKNLFFLQSWNEVKSELNIEEENEYEKEINKKFDSIANDPNKGKEKIIEAFLWGISYLFQNIEKHSSHSPTIRLLEEKWKNQEKREEWMKKNGFWEQYQEVQQEIEIEKRNLFSSPKTWILIVVALLLATIAWIFYRRRKTTKKKLIKEVNQTNF